MKKIILAIFVAIQLLILSACNLHGDPHDIYVTVYPLKYVTEEMLKGTDYTVGMVPGVTSHETSVDWSPKEIIAMTQATYLFYVGGNYDYYIDFQIDSIFKNKDVQLVRIENETDYIEFIPGEIHDHNHDHDHDDHDDDHDHQTLDNTSLGVDPHFWISPSKMIDVSTLVYDKLILAFPNEEEIISNNYTVLIQSLETLDNDFTEAISKLTKPVMTSTNLYGYLRHDYGLNFMPISTGYHEETDQFTSAQKQAIVEEALYHDIRHIIYEKFTTSPLSNAVFSELQTQGKDPVKLEFYVLESITRESINLGKNYMTLMYENLELFKTAGEYVE